MAIIKKGIKVGDSTYVNKVMIGDQTVYKVWSGTADLPKSKLIYYYNPTGTQGLSYSKSESGLQVSGIGSVTDTSIVVPSETYEYGDKNTIYTVNKIGDNAFVKVDGPIFTSIELPTTVNRIGTRAFMQYSNGDNPTTPLSVNLQNIVYFDESAMQFSGVTNVVLNSRVDELPLECFGYCTLLNTIDLKSVKSVGPYCFRMCKLTNMTGTDNIETIGDGAFWNTGSYGASFPKVTTLGEYSFEQSGIVTINMPNLKHIPKSAFENCKLLIGGGVGTRVIYTNILRLDVNTIGTYAFRDDTSILEIEIGINIDQINPFALEIQTGNNFGKVSFLNRGLIFDICTDDRGEEVVTTITCSDYTVEEMAKLLRKTYSNKYWIRKN